MKSIGFCFILQKYILLIHLPIILSLLSSGCRPNTIQESSQDPDPIYQTAFPSTTATQTETPPIPPGDEPATSPISPASPTTQSLQSAQSAEQIQKTLSSLKKINDFPFYTLNFEGDYGFENYLQNLQAQAFPLKAMIANELGFTVLNQSFMHVFSAPFACTVFSARTPQNEFLLARNFDWYLHPILLLFTDPPNGYASASMVDLSYLGIDRETDLLTAANSEALLRAPFLPFDGMNEHGLAIGMMAVAHSDGFINAEKGTLNSLEIIRLLLDYAGTVDEAITLMGQYNLDFGQGPAVHYLISELRRRFGYSRIYRRKAAPDSQPQIMANLDEFPLL